MNNVVLLDTVDAYRRAADALAQGRGPVAIDTERASGFRYNDRAFLVQVHRRGTPVFLIDPEGHRGEVEEIFAPVLNTLSWILHAAASDLPSLAMLGLRPRALFDTELAGRLLGLERVNLGAMHEAYLGIHLTKTHSAEDWSHRPLPQSWRRYAAEDVAYLADLADILAEALDQAGKLDIAEQEFDHVLRTRSSVPQPIAWYEVKGAATLSAPEQLATLRHLFDVRDALAREDDRAPGRILNTKLMVEMSHHLPTSRGELLGLTGAHRLRRQAINMWLSEIKQARSSDPSTWPNLPARTVDIPNKRVWERDDPSSWDILSSIKSDLSELADVIEIPTENLIRPASLRGVVWTCAGGGRRTSLEGVRKILKNYEARPWQVDLVAPIIAYHTARL